MCFCCCFVLCCLSFVLFFSDSCLVEVEMMLLVVPELVWNYWQITNNVNILRHLLEMKTYRNKKTNYMYNKTTTLVYEHKITALILDSWLYYWGGLRSSPIHSTLEIIHIYYITCMCKWQANSCTRGCLLSHEMVLTRTRYALGNGFLYM